MSQVWNAFKTGLKLKSGLANPCKLCFEIDRIAPKHCLLSEAHQTSQIKFMQKQKVNRNTYVLRFGTFDDIQLFLIQTSASA